ncbi:unannotated protein [freshwater metagenome]|uniref:Unannotated protein n=1 Tax=freshwater metagenome TaxID=449393 RepID=A0A6J7IKB2_9ZZZZ
MGSLIRDVGSRLNAASRAHRPPEVLVKVSVSRPTCAGARSGGSA